MLETSDLESERFGQHASQFLGRRVPVLEMLRTVDAPGMDLVGARNGDQRDEHRLGAAATVG
jgi:hypothetical protein